MFIQLKSAFLLIIFSFNMVVGFACAVGIDMGFNATHRHDEDGTKLHAHADGKSHRHEHKEHKHTDSNKKDDCCNNNVLKISQTDKAVPQPAKLLSPIFFTAFVATYYNIEITYPSQVDTSSKYYVRQHHPPIPDIRIAIQSFQI